MKEKMALWIVGLLIERLNSDDIKKWVDIGLDMLEKKIEATPTQYDDMIVLPLITTMRTAFSISDND